MGDRHWLAVHTKRTLMSEQCSDDVMGGRKKRAHVLEDNEEHPGAIPEHEQHQDREQHQLKDEPEQEE